MKDLRIKNFVVRLSLGLLRSKVGVLFFFCLRVQFSRRESARVDVKSNLKFICEHLFVGKKRTRRVRPEQTLRPPQIEVSDVSQWAHIYLNNVYFTLAANIV